VNIPALFINRPVATALLALAILLSGTLAFFQLPVAPLPNIAFPVIVVQANMAGASPDVMASTVAEPLEKRLGTIADVTEMTSTSYVGSAMIVIQFGLNRAMCRLLSRRRAPICRPRCAITRFIANTTRPVRRSWCWR